MFEPLPELAPDIDWMLQSGQASSEMLVEALVNEYYVPIYRLAMALLDDPEAARQTSQDVFGAALLNVYRYRSGSGVQVWIYQIAIEVCRNALRRLRRQRSFKASLPVSSDPMLFGSTTPSREADAALWLAVDALNEKAKLTALLHYLHGWGVSEIAQVLRNKDSAVQAHLRLVRQDCREAFHSTGLREEELDLLLSQTLQGRWPVPEMSVVDLDRIVVEVESHAGRQSSRRQRMTSVKEIALTLIAILFVAAFIWGANMLVPEPEPTELPIPTGAVTRSSLTESDVVIVITGETPTPQRSKTWPTPDRSAMPTPTPTREGIMVTVKPGDTLESIAKEMDTTVEELRELNRLAEDTDLRIGLPLLIPGSLDAVGVLSATRVPPVAQSGPADQPATSSELALHIQQNINSWNTLWIDAQVLIYGPEGYAGPPRVSRSQIWISREQLLVLIGSPMEGPEEVFLRNGTRFYRAKPGSNQPWFFALKDNDPLSNPTREYMNLFFNTFFGQQVGEDRDHLRVVESEEIAGRAAWVVEKTYEADHLKALLWVDQSTGLILRRQQFQENAEKMLRDEVMVTAITYDVDFPQELFNPQLPWRGGYARDFTGEPASITTRLPSEVASGRQRLDYNLVPEDFDPSLAQLTFQYPLSFNHIDSLTNTELFASDYYLGPVMFGNPWTLICDRSPDGQKIAYVSQPDKAQSQNAFLRWFNLSDPGEGVHRALGRTYVTHFAFSPDSHRLAVFGYNGQFAAGAIYILDIDTGEYNLLKHLIDANSFVWSPDGDYLALIATPTSIFQEEVMVIHTRTGEVVYREGIDIQSGRNYSDWPMLEWGIEFPVEMGGLETCARSAKP